MFEGYVKISSARLQANRTLAKAIFLAMPKNRKLLRLSAGGESLSEEIIRRIDGRDIFVLPAEGEGGDPDSILLYVEEKATESTNTVTAAATTAKAETVEPQSTTHSPTPEPNLSLTPIPSGEAAAESAVKISAVPEATPETRIAPSAQEQIPEEKFDAAEGAEAKETKVGAAKSVEAEKTKLHAEEKENEVVRRFSADKADTSNDFMIVSPPAPEKKAHGEPPSDVAEGKSIKREEKGPVLTLVPKEPVATTALSEDEKMEPPAPATELPADSRRELEPIGRELSTEIQKFREAAEASGEERLARLGSMLEGAGEAFRLFSTADDPGKDPALPGLASALESCLTEVEGLAAEGKEALLGKSSGLRGALGSANGAVAKKLRSAEAGFPATGRQDASQETWNATSPRKNDAAGTTLATLAYREMPQIAGRMAAILGHSLGYSSLDYLTDLALSAMVRFSAKAGAQIESAELPPLAQAALAPRGEPFLEGAIEDSLWILDFLEAYFENPECDRTQKEFSKRAFESTLSALAGGEQEPDPFVVARWRQFVGRGPTVVALSASSKASSRASRTARELISEIPR